MWSLPEINSLNLHAKSCATAYDREARFKTSRKHPCEGCGRPSTHHDKYFDIFSDDAKGVRHTCERCYDNGRADEGYFTCGCCGRLMVQNYTWEVYSVERDGQTFCLACAAKDYFGHDKNAINPQSVVDVELNPGSDRPLLKDGILNLAKAPHALGVKQPVPPGVKFIENFEYDSHSGRQISGGDILETLRSLDKPVFVVLDAAYQFAVSIGLYIREQTPSAA